MATSVGVWDMAVAPFTWVRGSPGGHSPYISTFAMATDILKSERPAENRMPGLHCYCHSSISIAFTVSLRWLSSAYIWGCYETALEILYPAVVRR